jgi:cardiolipin synthase
MARTSLLAGLAALLTACAPAATGLSPSPPPPIAGSVVVGGDRVTVLRGGEPTAAHLRELIDGARRSVAVEMYELGRPDLLAALIAAHRRGIAVEVIVDPSVDVSEASAARLRAAGVDVLEYPVRAMMIDHVKLLIVDSAVAVVGGINWNTNSFANHDFDAELRGPVATNLDAVFARDLITCGRTAPVLAGVDDAAIAVATTLPAAAIRPLAQDVIDRSTRSLDLELYVLTDTGIVHAVERAAGRGVAVRVLLDPEQRPSDAAAAELLGAGVAVRRYRGHGEKLHAKAAIRDAGEVLFGSANWSTGGFRRNHELDVDIRASASVARAFLDSFDADWAASA